MKKILSIIILLFCIHTVILAQGVVSVFRNDDIINEFLIEDIDSIVCRNSEQEIVFSDLYDTQVIYTKYGTFMLPLNLVDSASFLQPLNNGYVFNPEDIEDWDEGYAYQSTNDEDMSVACVLKQFGNESLMYLNRLNALNDYAEGYIFVMSNDGVIKNFVHNGAYFSLIYEDDNITIHGVDSLGNDIFYQKIEQIGYAPLSSQSRKAVSLDNIKNGYDTFSKIFNGLDMANMAGRGAWKELFYSLFKTGIDMSKTFKKLSFPIKVVEVAYQIVSYDMRNQLYCSCKVNVEKAVKDKSSNSATVSLNIQDASSLSYVYNETETHYNYLHSEFEEPYSYVSVPHPVNQYYAGIVVKKDKQDVSYADYDIKAELNTINKTTSATNFVLSGLEVGEKYYIRPYVVADILLDEVDFLDFLDGGILYGPVYEYVFNGISTDFTQSSCTYLGRNKMGISFGLSAEIAGMKDINTWGIVIKDKDGKEIGTYYADSGSSDMDIEEEKILDKGLFNSDNVAEIALCPFYIYGYFATPIYLESIDEKIEWQVTVETKDAVSIDANTENINCYVEGFDMTDAPNDCAIGVLYKTTSNLTIENSNAAISDQKSGGDITITLRELEREKKYYYRAYVRIEDKYYYGDVKEFTTKAGLTTCPDGHHPHMIDMGLPSGTMWACCNVGASSPEQYGGYYAWGETEEKSYYDWVTYKYGRHCDDCDHIGDDIAGTQYDVAHVKWGGSWRMPTHEQQMELVDYCSWTWTTQNGVNGQLVTGPNGGTIFLPAAGGRWYEDLDDEGEGGYYWSSSLYPDYEDIAYGLLFGSDGWDWYNYDRDDGQSVRAVCP